MTSASAASPRSNELIGALLAVAMIGAWAAPATAEPYAAAPIPSDSLQAPVTDTTISVQVKQKLLADPDLRTSDIAVTTDKGMVALAGTVVTGQSKFRAEADAKAVSGVKGVDVSALRPADSK